MTEAVTHLLYLHGFRSSPQSAKAVRMQYWVATHRPGLTWWCPQLPPSPRQAIDRVLAGTAAWPRARMAVIGSSLGGFYATVLAERTGCRAVIINPAVAPARDLAAYVGEQTAFHDDTQRFVFERTYLDELCELDPGPITEPHRYLGLFAMGDELLDWREMVARYPQAQVHVIPGSDHGLSDFDDHLGTVLAFLGLDR